MTNSELCSGYGKYHTDKNGKAYAATTLASIFKMAASPPTVPKDSAQWVIFSSLKSREAARQRNEGNYYALWADIDEHTTAEAIDSFLTELGGYALRYSSRSAKSDFLKWRIILPLKEAVNCADFELLQEILNDKLASAKIKPDPATERANQVCYLPNKGEHYEHRIFSEFAPIDAIVKFKDEIAQKQAEQAKEKADREARREASRLKAVKMLESGTHNGMQAFKQLYSVHDELLRYGYKKIGSKYLSPNSSSGNAGVTVNNDKWYSNHSSDLDIGSLDKNGKAFGDVFDLFKYYEHGNNEAQALSAVNNMFEVNGVSYEKLNQQAFKKIESKEADVVIAVEFNQASGEQPKEPFSLKQFSLRGDSAMMKQSMLDDKFVLDKIALLGQATAIYAKPNTGKTLLTIWMLIESIKAGNIEGDNVYYVNADDDFKGLTFKTELAEKHGFELLTPGQKGFESEALCGYMRQLIDDGTAKGVVIILDTLKKFTNLMDKGGSSAFMRRGREFVSSGGTLIVLAHTNKNRDADGKAVPGGTSDIIDDVDCAYVLDETSKNLTTKTVLFENIKSRGNVAREVSFTYSIEDGRSYQHRLDSVSLEDNQNTFKAKADLEKNLKREKDQPIINAIVESIQQGITLKTELIIHASKESGESKPKITKVLIDPDYCGNIAIFGHLWREHKEVKNGKRYSLLSGESTADDYRYARDKE